MEDGIISAVERGGTIMTLREVEDSYDFHDSILEKIYYEEAKAILIIDLCNWRQKDFKEGGPEMIRVKLILNSSEQNTQEDNDTKVIGKTILEVNYKQDFSEVEFILLNDEDGSINIIEIIARSSEVVLI